MAAGERPAGLEEKIPFVKAGRLAVKGEQTVAALEADGAEIPCAGVFILRQAVAPTDLLPQLETENGAIQVDRRMATSVAGVFAAGTAPAGPFRWPRRWERAMWPDCPPANIWTKTRHHRNRKDA